jgi:hypothetical protein
MIENKQVKVQKAIFNEIKSKFEGKKTSRSLVEELAQLLNVSTDSAYRRLRCEKFLTLDELEKISMHFRVSFDKHLALSEYDSVIFKVALNQQNTSFDEFLTGIHNDLETILQHPNHKLIYSAKEVPIFHFLQIPELAAFKMFYWMKTLFQLPEYSDLSFSFDFISEKHLELAKRISELYKKVNSYEIWNFESVHSFIAQTEFYFQSGMMNKKTAITLLDKFTELLTLIRKQADIEFKCAMKGVVPKGHPKNYNLYFNEIILSDNTIYVEVAGNSMCYIPHALLYYMTTTDKAYCDHLHNVLEGVMRKSTKISGTAEKHRSIFFNYVFQKIEEAKDRLAKSL